VPSATARRTRVYPSLRNGLLAVFVGLMIGFAPEAQAQSQRNKKQLSVQEQYDLGVKYSKRGYYIKALEQLNRVRNYHRDDPYAVKAELAIADVYFEKREWDQARLAYEDFQRMHPRHSDLDYVVAQIGRAWYKKAPKAAGRDQSYTRQAIVSWSGFDTRFPESDLKVEVMGDLAECRERMARRETLIARFYVRRGAWRAVEGRADGLLRTWPGSSFETEGLALYAVASAHRGMEDQANSAVARLEAIDQAAAAAVRQEVAGIAAAQAAGAPRAD
jgi:outer membrane protein assembly factor BamD